VVGAVILDKRPDKMMGVRACFRCSCFIIWFSNSSTGDAVVLLSPETRDKEVAGVADEAWACSLLFVAVACVTVIRNLNNAVMGF
jgi:hypothetical protein